jgi:outer membrane protein assembly factor BamB
MPLLATAENWPTYLRDATRSSVSGESFLSRWNAAGLQVLWSFKAGDVIVASASVVNDTVYVGAWNGYEYALDASTGALQWKTYLGQTRPGPGCVPPRAVGVSSAAAVVNGVVYVGGGYPYLFALNAATGRILWRVYTGNNSPGSGHYNWSSPLVYGDFLYDDVSSYGSCPNVQGEVLKIDLATHAVAGVYTVVPDHTTGGGVWGSAVMDHETGLLFIATGNASLQSQAQAQAVVAIDPATMRLVDSWAIPWAGEPYDSDFGYTPDLVDVGSEKLIVAINKNGMIYALNRLDLHAGPVWQQRIAIRGSSAQGGAGSISHAVNARGTLFLAGGITTIGATEFSGSVRAVHPATGKVIWLDGAPGIVIGGLTYLNGLILDCAGAVFEVRDATTGKVLYHFTTGDSIYASPSVANGHIYVGSTDGNLYAFGLPASMDTRSVPGARTGRLSALFNNDGIASDGVASVANLDGYGYAYSAQALAARGIKNGARIHVQGLTFIWPTTHSGQPDNVETHGQTVLLPFKVSATTLGFLGAATAGPSGGMATIHYTDGSSEQIHLAFSDWTLGFKGNVKPLAGTRIVASMTYRDTGAGTAVRSPAFLFYAGYTLEKGKSVRSVTLPRTVNGGPVHIFAVALGRGQP